MSATPSRRLLYVGGRALFREALRAALARHGTTVVVAASLAQALEELKQCAIDAAIVDDETLGEAAALDAVATLVHRDSRTPCAVLSGSRSTVFPADAIRAGAAAYLSKDMPLVELRYALDRLGQGQMVVDPTVMRSLLGILGPGGAVVANGNGNPRLSPVERRVLALASEGMPNKQIAARLGLSPLTVKNHIARIRSRLGASDKAQAVAIAIRGGLLD